MVSHEAGEGAPGSAIIWYLDWLDDQGVPHSEHLDDHFQGFKQFGADGWRLVQVIERPAAEGVYDGPAVHAPRIQPAGARKRVNQRHSAPLLHGKHLTHQHTQCP